MARQREFLLSLSAVLTALALSQTALLAAEDDAWRDLFDGKTLAGWHNGAGKPPGAGWVVEDGAVVRKDRAGYLWTKER
ncbi:family 16 glycoside hydrolase, partial [Planctomycetota bacterium]